MSDQQQSLNSLLQWGIKNSSPSASDHPPSDAMRGLDPDMLAQLLGGPSDADRMREAMTAIVAPLDRVDLANKLIAWDNLEQLIEQIDNANNMEALGLWPPTVAQLDSPEPDMRRMAAWCCSTAVQNNIKAQECLLAAGAVPKLVALAQADPEQKVRKKACSALSSEVRNFQPGMDAVLLALPLSKAVDAGDMDAVDEIIQQLRAYSPT